jgi:hypothetical protein
MGCHQPDAPEQVARRSDGGSRDPKKLFAEILRLIAELRPPLVVSTVEIRPTAEDRHRWAARLFRGDESDRQF